MRLHNKDKRTNLVKIKITGSFMSQKMLHFVCRMQNFSLQNQWKIQLQELRRDGRRT